METLITKLIDALSQARLPITIGSILIIALAAILNNSNNQDALANLLIISLIPTIFILTQIPSWRIPKIYKFALLIGGYLITLVIIIGSFYFSIVRMNANQNERMISRTTQFETEWTLSVRDIALRLSETIALPLSNEIQNKNISTPHEVKYYLIKKFQQNEQKSLNDLILACEFFSRVRNCICTNQCDCKTAQLLFQEMRTFSYSYKPIIEHLNSSAYPTLCNNVELLAEIPPDSCRC